MLEGLVTMFGTLALYAILWGVLFLGIFLGLEKFSSKPGDFVSGPILGFFGATIITVILFFYNHVSFTF